MCLIRSIDKLQYIITTLPVLKSNLLQILAHYI